MEKKELKYYLIFQAFFFLISMFLIWGILSLYHFYLQKSNIEPTKELVECMANNSVLYVQKGCSSCLAQEKLFGGYSYLLKKVDCFDNISICIKKDITKTPTWILSNGKRIEGKKSIKYLANIMECKK